MAPKCYIICEARHECLRMAADKIRPKKDIHAVYIRAKPKTVGDILLSLVDNDSSLEEGDDIYIVVPLIDPPQKKNVIAALTKFTKKNINYFWYHAPEWFDKGQTANCAVTEAKNISPVPDTVSAEAASNTHYTKEPIKSVRSNITSYIDYRLMYFFMGADTAENTLKAIITALAKCDEDKFYFPSEEDEKMPELVKQFIEIQPSMAGRTDTFEAYKKRIVALARLDKDVMIIGETGTGKEATAYYLHEFSLRRGKKFIPVNCACYTDDLLMSELFGHVKGSFSGATSAKIGLVEEAKGGTMFLDEIPDASPRVQAMLLRFLQSGEYSAVGSNKSEKVDVKIIAGAQPGLLHKLRNDLQYRLEEKIHTYSLKKLNSVNTGGGYPDIISMARNLAANSIGSPKMSDEIIFGFNFDLSRVTHEDVVKFWKEIAKSENVELLTSYDWPGNVRELQTFISRHLCENKTFKDAMSELKNESTHSLSVDRDSSFVSFSPITSLDSLIPYYEPENMYLELIKESRKDGCLKNYKPSEIQEKLKYSSINTYKKYIEEDETKKVKRTKSAKTEELDSKEIAELK